MFNKKKVTLARSQSTYLEWREETQEGVVPKIALLPARQSMWLIPVFTHAGHFLWLQALPGVPPYLVPSSTGYLESPSLSAFYMLFTMIILLQVEESVCVWESIHCWRWIFIDVKMIQSLLLFLFSFLSLTLLPPIFPFFPSFSDPDSHLPLHFHWVGEDWSDLLHHQWHRPVRRGDRQLHTV